VTLYAPVLPCPPKQHANIIDNDGNIRLLLSLGGGNNLRWHHEVEVCLTIVLVALEVG